MNFHCGLTAKNWQNNYLQSVNWQGKSLRLVGLPGPKGLHEIKSTKKQLRVGGIRVWGFLLARGLEAPLTVKMPGNYGVNCVANTTSRTCVKGRCFSPPLLICLLLFAADRDAKAAHSPSQRPARLRLAWDGELVVGLSLQTGFVPTEDNLPGNTAPLPFWVSAVPLQG